MEVINTQNQSEDLNAINTGVVVQETPQKKTGFFKILLIIFFVLLLFSTLFYFLFYKKDPVLEQETEKQETALEQLEGEIYLTLAPVEQRLPNIYKLDVETTHLEPMFPVAMEANYMGRVSPDGSKMVFVRSYENGLSQVMVLDFETEEILELTEVETGFPRNPQFSSNGLELVYYVEDEEDSITPEEHPIYLYSFDNGSIKEVAQGAFPFFYKDSNFLIYLKNDGLYSLNRKTMKEQLLVSSVYPSSDMPENWNWLGLRFDFLQSKNLFAISDSFLWKVSFFEIASLETVVYEEISELKFPKGTVAPMWPVFPRYLNSPDKEPQFFASQSFYEGTDVSKLSIFEIESGVERFSLNLSDYDVDYIWVTDWILK